MQDILLTPYFLPMSLCGFADAKTGSFRVAFTLSLCRDDESFLAALVLLLTPFAEFTNSDFLEALAVLDKEGCGLDFLYSLFSLVGCLMFLVSSVAN